MARTVSDASPEAVFLADSLSMVLGLPGLPKGGFERKELLEVGQSLMRSFRRFPKEQVVQAMQIVIERNQFGEYLTPRRAFWYISQRLRELHGQNKTSPQLEPWQRQLSGPIVMTATDNQSKKATTMSFQAAGACEDEI